MHQGISREFDVRLRDEENDKQNLSAASLNRLAEAEAAYSPHHGWEAAMQAFADSLLSAEPRKKARPQDGDDGHPGD